MSKRLQHSTIILPNGKELNILTNLFLYEGLGVNLDTYIRQWYRQSLLHIEQDLCNYLMKKDKNFYATPFECAEAEGYKPEDDHG